MQRDRRCERLEFDVRGPSATRGYLRNPAATARLFDGEWLDSGDLAYIAGGDVYLTSRVKDVIIRGGRIIDPATWQPHETNVGPSFWGHERLHLGEQERAAFRDMRLATAAAGKRTPHLVNCPWLYGQFPGA